MPSETPPEPKSEPTDGPCCAHSRVLRTTVDAGPGVGLGGRPTRYVRDRWACADCDTDFMSAFAVEQLLARVKELEEARPFAAPVAKAKEETDG